jgi:hypothetical protein
MSQNQILFFIFLFCLNPFLGTLSLLIVKMMINKRDTNSDFLVFLFITLFACLLQYTRIWDTNQPSDWYNDGYWGLFLRVSDTSFVEYIIGAYKEPVWNLLNYIGYYITRGNYQIFSGAVAIATNGLLAYSIYRYWKYVKLPSVTLISMLSLLLFFTEYWGTINNLLRQFFAVSIVIYVYVGKIISGKVNWWLLIAACFIHTLAFIFLPLLICKPLYQVIKWKQMLYLIIALCIATVAINHISFFSSIFSGIDFLAYGLKRIESAGDPLDQNFLDPVAVYTTAGLMIVVCIFMNYVLKKDSTTVFFTNLLFFLMLICILIVNLMPEIMGRIYVMRFCIWPFVLPLFMVKYKPINTVYAWGIFIFFFTRFLVTFDDIRGGGFFPPIADLLPRTLIQYLI